MIDGHTNENIPGNIKVSRQGDQLIIATRLATIRLPLKRAKEVAQAILEVTP